MEQSVMPSTLRLNSQEKEELRKRSIELNKQLINNGHSPLRESELAHIALESALKWLRVDKDGNVFLDL